MRKQIVNAGLVAAVARFFPATLTIRYYAAENPDTFGQPGPVWILFPGHIALDCSIAPVGTKGGVEIKRPDMTTAISTHIIALAGYYPTIEPWMRAVISGVSYDILIVDVDSHSTMTRLNVERVI